MELYEIFQENVHLTPSPVDKLREGLMQFRERCEERLYHIFPADEASVLSDMILGNKQDISPEIKELYRKNGISHILSISSLHISILGLGLYMALRKTGAKIWICGGITGLFLLSYAVMTGMSISAMRAVIMFLIKLLADAVGRTVDSLTSLSLTALILLIPNPAAIGSCSFLLSFGSVAGIICLYPVLKKPFEGLFRKKPIKRWQKILLGILNSVLMSLSISLTTLPITLWFFYEIPTYSIFLNIIILPFMSLLIVSTIFAMLIPGGGFIGTIGYLILKFYEAVCRVCNYLPLYTWNPGRPKVWMIILYYAVWLMIVLSPITVGYLLKFSKLREKKKNAPKHPAILKILPLFLLILLPIILSFPKMSRNTLTMLDVGQGDGMIYYTDNREVYLIDGGSSSKNDLGEYVLKPALKYYGFSTVDVAFISHPDTDHLSGITELLENSDDWGIKIKQVVLPKCKTPADFRIKNANITYISAGDTWKSGDNRFTCLHPGASFKADDTNEMSECIYIKFFEKQNDSPVLLLTGDVQGEGEKALTKRINELNKANDTPALSILKVAHHGSKYSTLDSFLKAYKPSIALISAGKNNHYGHPHKETLSRLDATGTKIYNTQKNGAITITVTPHKMIINTFID